MLTFCKIDWFATLALGLVVLECQTALATEAVGRFEFSRAGYWAAPGSPRRVSSFNLGWEFSLDGFRTCRAVSLPHGIDEGELLPQASGCVNRQQAAWYRKRFTWHRTSAKIFLHFEAVMGKCRVTVNGRLAAEHFGGYLPIHVDVTDLLKDGENEVVVWCDNSDDPTYPPGKPQRDLDFAYFGGIYRDVWLVETGPAYVTDSDRGGVFVRTRPQDGGKWEVAVDAAVEKGEGDEVRFRCDGKPVLPPFALDRPTLWTPDEPNLHDLDVEVLHGGQVSDAVRVRFGVRELKITGEGLFVNGRKWRKLVGVNRHQDYLYLGNALANSLHWRDAKKYRDAGFTAIRNAHYPQDPAFMDACDAQGLLVIVTTPGWQFWNEKEPKFAARVYDDIAKMCRRDRSRASLLMWEPILNETRFPAEFAARARAIVKAETRGTDGVCACDPTSAGSGDYDVVYTACTVTPAYGNNEGYEKGDEVPCSASPVWTNEAETIAATCAGYKVYVNGVETESKSANSFTYVHPDSPKGAKLVWQWDVKYKMTVSAGEGGTVDTDEEWVAAGGTITLTATPGEGNSFYRWTGDIGDADPSAATITVPADRPRQLTATFGLARYVGGESGDYATLEAALQGAAGGDTIILRKNTYTTTAEIILTDGITIRGETGDPADVIVQASGNHRMFTLNSPGAKLVGLTISGGRSTAGNGAGVFIGANGGTVEKCAIRDCQCNAWHLIGSGIYIAANSPGLVDSCVISGCSTTRGDFTGGLAIALDGGEARNCLVTGNTLNTDLGSNGGSVYVNGGRLVNCTVADNTLANCPGVWAVQGEVVNCIIAENTCTTATGADAVTWAGEASCFDHCVGTAAMNDTCTVVEHPFVDAAHGDYTPVIGTAAVDGGVAEGWMVGATDFRGKARVSGVAPDVGAFECDQTSFSAGFRADVTAGKAPLAVTFTVTALGATGELTCHWDLDSDGVKETTSTGTTFTHVFDEAGAVDVLLSVADGAGKSCDAQLPVRILVFGDEIRVRKTSPAPAFPYDTWENAAASLEEVLAVAYDGSEIVVSNDTYETAAEIKILKGVTVRGLTGDPEDVVFKAKGSHRMFWIDNPDAKLSGVTVSGGTITTGKGGGIYIDKTGGTVEKCVIRDCKCNVWQGTGGGVYVAADSDNSLLDACIITGCGSARSDFLGGLAITLDGGVARNCLITGNESDYALVGAVRVNGGELVNCTVTGNKTAGCPGVWAGSGKVVNCIIAENTHKTSTDPKTITWSGEASCFDHCVGTDAMNGSCEVLAHPFADPEHDDYSPVLGAAAVDTGVTEDWMDGAKDLLGNDRVSGSDPDIGAIEYDQSQFTASFSAAVSSGKAPLVVEFEVQTVGATGGITCFWDWDGDGEADAETDGSTSHTFETATYAEVRLTVKDNNSKKVVEVPLPVRVKAFGEAICVVKDNANAAPPYDSWANAAADLVTAYDFAEDECEIVVSNGTYETASVIQILKEVTLRGVSGNPEDVVIQATGSHRMFWLDNPKAKLSGLTVKGGVLVASSDGGGGVYIGEAGGTVEKCVICDCQCNDWHMVGSGIYIAAGSGKGLVDSCVIRGCSTARSDFLGGLAIALDGGVARNCLITGNDLTGFNISSACGAVRVNGGELVNCTVTGNTSVQCPGVVAVSGKVVNCLIAENVNTTSSDAKTVTWSGEASCFDHCVGTDAMNESCAVLAHPFADSAHGDYSPLLGTTAVDHGVAEDWMDGARDFLGNDRVSGTAPDIGAIEYDQSRLSVGFAADVSFGKAPLTVTFTVTAVGATGELSCAWDLDGDGDTDATSDGTSFTYTFEDPCAVNVGLHVVDGGSGQECDAALPRRICAFGQAILVSTTSPSPAEPYDTWTNAATNFEDAVAIACADVDVVVSNGTYMTEEEINLSDAITIRGLTGDPADAVIRAQGEHRVFRLDNSGAKLSGLTVAGGTMSTSSGVGGGIYIGVNGGTVEKCVIRECKCTNWATSGGGIYIAPGADRGLVDSCVITECGTTRGDFAGGLAMTLDGGMARNCLVTGNHFEYSVNAACGSVRVNGGELVNCTVAGNDCVNCPGVVALSGKVVNCAIGENVTQDTSKTYNTCWAGTADCFNRCIGPVKINDNCFEGENLFVDAANGDFRLAKDSPALDKGVKEPWMKGDGKDFFGQKRISHFRPDLGFHELQVYNGFKISVK